MSAITSAYSGRTAANLYVVASVSAPFGLTDDSDGKLLVFTDWAVASKAAGARGGFVTNIEQFSRRYLARMSPKPAALRIVAVRNGSSKTFHAELDAQLGEIRQALSLSLYHEVHGTAYKRPDGAKVWEEAK